MQEGLRSRKSYEEYTVAVVCAMEFEMNAVRYMLDLEHISLPRMEDDSNIYILGELNSHNVVLACLPGNQGKGSAAIVTTNTARTFPSIKWRFLVGIGRGIPSDNHDIRLGDVVVSMPEGQYGGVVQYDLGKDTDNGFILKGFLSPPPALLRSAALKMRSDHRVNDNKIEEYLSAMLQKGKRLSIYRRPATRLDVLFDTEYPHNSKYSTCEMCDQERSVRRPCRESEMPEIHYGLIASGDRVMTSAVARNKVVHAIGNILCFEMEAAGLMTEFPCVVIRGISDYADSHKNDGWQHFAAAAAAACAKELISYLNFEEVSGVPAPSVGTASKGDNEPNPRHVFHGKGLQHTASGSIFIGGDIYIS